MGEYQYYEFQAVDRPLTMDEMAALRKITSRATITPTRLQNEYRWGNFKGDPLELMERYFDGFVYVANWGTNQFMLRLPAGLLDLNALSPYAVEDCLAIRRRGDYLLIDFQSQDEEGEWWIDGCGTGPDGIGHCSSGTIEPGSQGNKTWQPHPLAEA